MVDKMVNQVQGYIKNTDIQLDKKKHKFDRIVTMMKHSKNHYIQTLLDGE